MSVETFGTLSNGEAVERVTIRGGGLTASILGWGATVQDLRLQGHAPPLVLGFPVFDPYPVHALFFGAIVGRYANRIAGGRFSIDGEAYETDRNEGGLHTLHGGAHGVYCRNWTIAEAGQDHARLELVDRDGEMGFPGTCRLAATFRLPGDGVLAIALTATTDRSTIVNLTHHGYFNLDGTDKVLDHEMRIDAGHYLPVDSACIPTGAIDPVDGTDLDFRQARALRRDSDGRQVLYDHNYCISGVRTGLREVAMVRSPRSGVTMTLATTEPGLQFYAGEHVGPTEPGLAGKAYGKWAGFCLEPQIWPDAPNRPDFPSALLRPGETSRQEMRYRFTREG
ncbi:MAG: aldose epimerase family protein [Pseudomonadota bacterium]|nr:aldose epimerase family protein [Pseudomonadota bacterium]